MTEQTIEAVYTAGRRTTDRRQARFRSLFYGILNSRRKQNRRQSDVTNPHYADVHGAMTLAVVLSIMLLCVLDAYFTLLLISHGSSELNPLLAWALDKDAMFFYGLKYSMTAFCVYVIMMHKYFYIFGVRGYKLLLGALGVYLILISYQLSMLLPVYL